MPPGLLYTERVSKKKLRRMRLNNYFYIIFFVVLGVLIIGLAMMMRLQNPVISAVFLAGIGMCVFWMIFFGMCLGIEHKPLRIFKDHVQLPQDRLVNSPQDKVKLEDVLSFRIREEKDGDVMDYHVVIKTAKKEFSRELLIDSVDPGLKEAIGFYEETLKRKKKEAAVPPPAKVGA